MAIEILKKTRPPAVPQNPREDMCELLLKILKGILPHSEDIRVSYMSGEKTTIYEVICHEQDYGYLLGKKGATISSLRCIVAATLARNDIRAIVEAPYIPKPSLAPQKD